MGTADKVDYADFWLTQVVGTHGATADGTPRFLQGGGVYKQIPTANADGLWVTTWIDGYGRTHPNLVNYQLDTVTTATGSGTGSTTRGFGAYKELDLHVNVTTAGGTSPTLDLFVDSRLDGTTYVNIAHLTAITAIQRTAVHLSRSQGTNIEVGSANADAGAGTLRRIGWGDDLRIRRDITGTTPSFTYTVYVHAVA